jgi:molybdopterin converting factor small subunit
MAQIKIPAVLAGGSASSTVEISGNSLAEVFENHAAEHGSELRDSVIQDGEIKEFINVYVDGTEVSDLETTVSDKSQIRVIPAASGG